MTAILTTSWFKTMYWIPQKWKEEQKEERKEEQKEERKESNPLPNDLKRWGWIFKQ